MNLEEICEKIRGIEDYQRIREILTDEEYIYYILHHPFSDIECELSDGDERLIADILKKLSSKEYSINHVLHILDVTKQLIQITSRFNF